MATIIWLVLVLLLAVVIIQTCTWWWRRDRHGARGPDAWYSSSATIRDREPARSGPRCLARTM